MLIRHAVEADAPAMGVFQVQTWLAAHRTHISDEAWQTRLREWTPEVSAQGWARTLREIDEVEASDQKSNTCIFLAVDNTDEIVGIAIGYPSDEDRTIGEVGSIYIAESHRGQGIGRRLVQMITEHLAERGMKSLQIAVLAANAPARRFYEKIGGHLIAEREGEEEGPQVVYAWPEI